jgi:hypothetical protein
MPSQLKLMIRSALILAPIIARQPRFAAALPQTAGTQPIRHSKVTLA